MNVCTSLLILLCAVKSSCCGIHGDRPTQLAELPRSKFDPELFSHSAYDKFFVTFTTKVSYLTFCDKMRQFLIQVMDREGGNKEKMRKCRKWISLHFLILSLFPPSLSITYIKNCLILSQNVANVIKNIKYALWENNSADVLDQRIPSSEHY